MRLPGDSGRFSLRSEESSRESPRQAWRAYIDLELPGGAVARQETLEKHTVIGRSPNLQLSLDHDTVSRRHAELFCDPFGRWWIRDLGSTNGTAVNGERIVTERVLRPGDRIGIGDYRLRFYLGLNGDSGIPPAAENAPSIDETRDDSSAPSWIKSLSDLSPPQIAASHLSKLMSFSRKLISLDDSMLRLEALCQLCISPEFHGVVAMGLRARPGQPIRIIAGPVRPPENTDTESPYISRGILKQVVETGEPALASNLPFGGSASLELTLSADVVPLAAVACPLTRDGDFTDILYVNLPPQFGRAEWLSLLALAAEAFHQAELAWAARRHAQDHAAIERELETARQIQQALIPKELNHPKLDLAVRFAPCKWVGGDYVDTVPMANGRLLLTVADVCGKGLQAALVTFSLHTMIRLMSELSDDVPHILARLNQHLLQYIPQDSFVTMTCIALDPETGELECVNAGHPAAFVGTPSGSVRRLQSEKNPAVGMAPCEFVAEKDKLEPGEVLLLYTDGLTELRNTAREMLGDDLLGSNFGDLCKSSFGKPVEAIANSIDHMLDDFRGDQLPEDDRAILLARRR